MDVTGTSLGKEDLLVASRDGDLKRGPTSHGSKHHREASGSSSGPRYAALTWKGRKLPGS